MFKIISKLLPWRGEEVKSLFEQAGIQASKECAEYIVERAIYHAPEDTGELKRSIKAIPTLGGRVWNVVAEADHAPPVEYGSLHGNTWIKPNPFMRRAVADARVVYPEILKGAYVQALRSEGKNLGITFRAI